MDTRQTIVALFASTPAAEFAKKDLIEAGIPESDIRIRVAEATTDTTATTTTDDEPGFWDWLFGSDYDRIPERDRTAYSERVRRGEAVLTVTAIDTDAEYDRVADIIEAHRPMEMEDTTDTTYTTGATTSVPPTASVPPMANQGQSQTMGGLSQDQSQGQTMGGSVEEEVIPVTKEELHVGKKEVRSARAYRVRSTVTEVPVEETVNLRDETVTVERRPTTGYTGTGDPFTDRVVEVHETHEEPVVEKTVRSDEEVVVRKDTHDHTETVRDTVRETKVDVDKPTDPDRI